MNDGDELHQLEATIAELQRRAEILRRVRQRPDASQVAQLHRRYREAHFNLHEALSNFREELQAVLASVAQSIGYGADVDYREWLKLRPEIQPYLYDFEAIAGPFLRSTEHQLTHDVRRDVERLFLILSGSYETSGWFESLLAAEREDESDFEDDLT